MVTHFAHYSGLTTKFRILDYPRKRLPHVKNHKNCDIFPPIWPIFTKFGMVMQIIILTAPTIKNRISKIQDGGRPPS